MNDERVVEDIVTKFLLNTCRLSTKLSRPAVQAAFHCAWVANSHQDDDVEADFIPRITGSVAEFYIRVARQHIQKYRTSHPSDSEPGRGPK